jgi:thiamine-phosphate pyrophosphorylase
MPSILRIIDANANRAREALRVMEDAARFILDHAALSEACKQLRHDLAAALDQVTGLELHRDTPGDVGTVIATDREARRTDVAHVVTAAGKRLSEALRTIEEFAKTLPPPAAELAGTIERLRYRGYDIEHRLHLAFASTRARQWRLCVLLTRSLCTVHTWEAVLDACIDAGADCIQVREKQMDAGPLLDHCREVVGRCRPHGIAVVVNDRPDVALLSGADGVHLGQTDLPCEAARRLVGRQLLIGVSTACLDHARAAVDHGADYVGLGPMFPTSTKHKDVIVGPEYLRTFVQAYPAMPHLAIAGVTPANVGTLVAAGARGVAVSSAVCGAADPAAVVRDLLAVLPATPELPAADGQLPIRP